MFQGFFAHGASAADKGALSTSSRAVEIHHCGTVPASAIIERGL
jgi:hypothetical protein